MKKDKDKRSKREKRIFRGEEKTDIQSKLKLAKRGHKKEKTKRFTWVWLTNDQI